jgi:alkanesulfonate monooxygenase SsuD/methylene tetrahydromethanopterin reductase-like flavin-dependent oxidoreductase (luciferase family)
MTGSHFELVEAVASIAVLQQPHPPIWIGANVDKAVRRAARLGDCWYLNPHQMMATLTRQMDIYREELDSVGKPFPEEMPIRREVFCAPSHDQAIEIAAPYMKKQYDLYQTWGQNKAMAEGDQDITGDYDELARDRFIVGDPDEVAQEMLRYHEVLGVNHIIMSVQGVGMPQGQVLDTFQLMAEEVFPKVRKAL